MTVKTCERCGAEYDAKKKLQRFCCSKCRNGFPRTLPKLAKSRPCETCGTQFAPKTQWQRFCSLACKPILKRLKKECAVCSKPFNTSHAEQVYCGRSCARSAEVALKYESGVFTPKRVACCPHCGIPSKGALACADCRQMVDAERNKRYCKDCGTVIALRKQRCLSCIAIRNKASRARSKKKNGSSAFNARARRILRKIWGQAWRGLYEPLSWRAIRKRYKQEHAPCAICANAIDYGAKAPDPMALSLDHIIALVNGGTHYEDNIQPAHFICNTRKGMKRSHDGPYRTVPL